MARNPYGKPATGYSSVPQGGSPIHTEAWALIEAARRIAEAIAAYEQNPSREAIKSIRDVLRLNWRVWTIFQAELTAESSPIPPELRINMLTLCKYVDTQTVALLAQMDPERALQLVDINRNIATGLLEGLNKALAESAETKEKSTPQAAVGPSAKPIDKTA